ncbi:THO COMPLEX SUBUNIT 2, partial [Salix koriyanagi]
MELRGHFQYLVNQLKRGQGIELVLLQELVQQMANVQYTENLTEEQRNRGTLRTEEQRNSS